MKGNSMKQHNFMSLHETLTMAQTALLPQSDQSWLLFLRAEDRGRAAGCAKRFGFACFLDENEGEKRTRHLIGWLSTTTNGRHFAEGQ